MSKWRMTLFSFRPPFPIAALLNTEKDSPLPEDLPPLPNGIDGFIMVPSYKGQVLVWFDNRWSTHQPWDE